MDEDRPAPDQLLARMKIAGEQPSQSKSRGSLKVFFGYAAGVGKTYAMLQAAKSQLARGTDIVIGYVEPHGRKETEALLEGFEILPLIAQSYAEVSILEFDLDGALARKPQVMIVDELAHTNAPGSRHTKRWQDVEELLDVGIDVYTTVNVQHIESLNDVIAQITGIRVRETIPDAVLAIAEEVVLVDVPPEDLLLRLESGKIYIPEQAKRALQQFFRKENLLALRELSLRTTAQRVHEDVELARYGAAANIPWNTSEKLLVCVGPSPSSKRVLRAAKRLADSLKAQWIAMYVETPGHDALSVEDKMRVFDHLKLADSLGAETTSVSGQHVVTEILDYANRRNVTKLVVGKTEPRRSFFSRHVTLVEMLLRRSTNIDVYVIRGLDSQLKRAHKPRLPGFSLRSCYYTCGSLIAATMIALLFSSLQLSEVNIVMVYLVAVVFVAAKCATFPSIVTSFLSVLIFDVLFIVPHYSITVNDTQYLFTFAVMLCVGFLVSKLTGTAREAAEISRRSEQRIESLYRFNKKLNGLATLSQIVTTSETALTEMFELHIAVLLPDATGNFYPLLGHRISILSDSSEIAAAQWTFDNNKYSGRTTDTLPNRKALYLPLVGQNRSVGVVAVEATQIEKISLPETRQMLTTCCSQIALALERSLLRSETKQAELQVESERLRSAFLSSISHDLRTPLAAIAGASSSLLETTTSLSEETKKELQHSIYEESLRLSQLVQNILSMTKLTSSEVKINCEWHPLEEVVGSALRRLDFYLSGRNVTVELAQNAALGYFDAMLIEQLLYNLLDNAIKYSDKESEIAIRTHTQDSMLIFEVLDRGKGIVLDERDEVFKQFYRGASERNENSGTGLGLAICSAIAKAHHGSIAADAREGGGTLFRVSIPQPILPAEIVEIQQQQDN